MNWHNKNDVVETTANSCLGSGSSVRQALLIFANPVTIDCEQRKWPAPFQRLFNTGRLSGLTTPETDVHLFTSVQPPASKSGSCTVHLQKYIGTSFGERLESAVECLAALGYRKIVIVGSDCPSLTAEDVSNAFRLLDHKRLVLGPDHRGGCYLIGLHGEDRLQFASIRWHQNTDFAELLQRCGESSTAQLPVQQDLDTLEDIRLLAESASVWSALASELLHLVLAIYSNAEQAAQCIEDLIPRLFWQLPPPSPSLLRH
jgi:hypothetical protein